MDATNKQKINRQKVKIVFLGDKAVGKSSIINKFALNKFQESTQATIGVDYLSKNCRFNNCEYKLELWDTAGQQKYRSLIKGYLRGADACVFVYDRSNPSTYLNLIDWIKAFEEVVENQNTFIMIFSNKNDLESNDNEFNNVRKQTHEKYHKLNTILEIAGSAKTAQNINQIFQEILEHFSRQKANHKIHTKKTIGQKLITSFKNTSKSAKSFACCQ